MMRLVAKNIPVSLSASLPANQRAFAREVAHALGVKAASLDALKIERRSVDARKKDNVHFVMNVSFEPKLEKPLDFWRDRAMRGVQVDVFEPRKPLPILNVEKIARDIAGEQSPTSAADPENGRHTSLTPLRPVIVGSGPAGLFCALYLARVGMKPLLIERGQAVEDRIESVRAFNEGYPLNPESNIQFGEGGAGTFSDGKLTTGTKSSFNSFVLEEFAAAGAPPDILIDAKPHIGTDYLVDVVANLRRAIIEAGGEVRFSTRLVDLVFADGDASGSSRRISAIKVLDAAGETEEIPTNALVLACGHSARDTFQMLADRGIAMERKQFAVGVRIEHPQKLIDAIQYGKFAGDPALPPADYKLAVKTREGRGVYTFCMCPGGEVVAATSESDSVCVNGMSNHARDGKNANSALLVEIRPDDIEGDDVLGGVLLQRELEQVAFADAGGYYRAPMQEVGAFLGKRAPAFPKHLLNVTRGGKEETEPTYPRGCTQMKLAEVLPSLITDSLKEGLIKMDGRMRGFAYPHANLIGVEARSSSPVRIIRSDDTLQSVNADGLFPAGEGAGYAGGIMSAATDGLRIARRMTEDAVFDLEFPHAISVLERGGMVVFPTDTVCGIGITATAATNDPTTMDALFDAKGRSKDKPFQWLIAGADDLRTYAGDTPSYVQQIVRTLCPGALTLIVAASDAVPAHLRAADGTIGLRIPAHATTQELIEAVGCPLITTSANRAGAPAVKQMANIDQQWLADILSANEIALLHGYTNERELRRPILASTVVDCTGATPKILREGAITEADIRAAI